MKKEIPVFKQGEKNITRDELIMITGYNQAIEEVVKVIKILKERNKNETNNKTTKRTTKSDS